MTPVLVGAALTAALVLVVTVVVNRRASRRLRAPGPATPARRHRDAPSAPTGPGPCARDLPSSSPPVPTTTPIGADELTGLAISLGLDQPEPGRYEGVLHGLPVVIRRPGPALAPPAVVKTELTTGFAPPPALPFLVHQRGPAVVGSAVITGDHHFDARFVVRSAAGAEVLALLGAAARRAITRYAAEAPAVDITDRRIDLVLHGPPDDTATLLRLLELQAAVVNAISTG